MDEGDEMGLESKSKGQSRDKGRGSYLNQEQESMSEQLSGC
jgi:hypothetical protein